MTAWRIRTASWFFSQAALLQLAEPVSTTPEVGRYLAEAKALPRDD